MLWLRSIIVYFVVVLLFRVLGRSLRFQARPYDVAVEVLIGSAAAHVIVDKGIPMWQSFLALGTLALLYTTISLLSLWDPVKRLLVGGPSTLVENGTILKANLIRHQINVEELIAAMRQQGYHTLSDVEFALLESSGKLSIIPKSQSRPVTPKDLGLSTNYEGYSAVLVTDGVVHQPTLEKLGLDRTWLEAQLPAYGVSHVRDVLFASLDTQGQLLVLRDQDVPFLQAVLHGARTQVGPGLPPLMGGAHEEEPAEPVPHSRHLT